MRKALKNAAIIAATLALAACAGEEDAAPARDYWSAPIEGNAFAITNARVFDGAGTTRTATIVVEAGRIVAVGADAAIPDGVPVIDGAGKTATPLLIDAHVHAFDDSGLESALRFGVGAELDHFTDISFFNAKKPARESLERTEAADLFSAGTLVTAPGGHGTQYGLPIPTITAPEEAEAFVAARLAEGSDWIKIVYEPGRRTLPSVSRETLFAVIAAAKAQGALVVVHVSRLEGVEDAVEAGAHGLVHINADAPIRPELVAQMKAQGMFVIPTLSVIASVAGEGNGAALLADADLAPYANAAQRQAAAQVFPTSPDYLASFKTATARDNVKALADAGVAILAGTDAPNPGTTYGLSMHGELAELVKSGLTAEEALVAATSAPANAFSIPERGALSVGARADILLVDGDPTTDVRALRKIARVFKNGYEIARAPQDAPIEKQVPAPPLEGGLVSDFSGDLGSGFGAPWSQTTDQIAGGASTVSLARAEPGADGTGGALRMEGEISAKFAFPWSGAGVFFSQDFSAAYDFSGYEKLTFMARGADRTYVAMFFTRDTMQRPAAAFFPAGPDWTRVEIPLADFRGASMEEAFGFALTAERPEGAFHLEIDDVRFE